MSQKQNNNELNNKLNNQIVSNNINEILAFEKNNLENLNVVYETDIITIYDFKRKEKMLYDVLDNFFFSM